MTNNGAGVGCEWSLQVLSIEVLDIPEQAPCPVWRLALSARSCARFVEWCASVRAFARRAPCMLMHVALEICLHAQGRLIRGSLRST